MPESHSSSGPDSLSCPHCGHDKAWKNGHRNGQQRWLCKNCGREYLHYVEPVLNEPINRAEATFLVVVEGEKHAERPVGAQSGTESGGEVEKCEQIQHGDLLKDFPSDLQAKILEFAVKRDNQNYKDVQGILYTLRSFQRNGADLYDPESVKETLKRRKISEKTKKTYVERYDAFLRFLGGSWEKPKYVIQQKIPFIPTEAEIDQFIAALSPTISTFCQVLKDTAGRAGEVARLKWTDIDFERRTIAINDPEKGSNPRLIKVSEKCMNMIGLLPRKSIKVFKSIKSINKYFFKQRKMIATRLNNPRLLEIGLHTFRHWKATMEYHKTHDIFYVKDFLGHKNIQNTMVYVTVERAIFQESSLDEFHSATSKTVEDACKLVEVGFEYVATFEDVMIFRKRK